MLPIVDRRCRGLRPWLALLALSLAAGGCSDERLVELSQQSVERQTEQNRAMAKQSQAVASATRELVEADAKARQELLKATRDLQAQSAQLDRQHAQLDQERRELDQARQRDPIIANAIQCAAILIAVVLPLALGWMIIRRCILPPENSEALNELLIAEFGAETPLLLESPSAEAVTAASIPRILAPSAARLPAPQAISASPPALRRPVIVVVKGIHDAEFLQAMSGLLHAADPSVPNLKALDEDGLVVFIPSGGGDSPSWADRLASLGAAEFHLYDRELPPVTQQRQELVSAINRRSGCKAVLTRKRAIENYLHPAAIREALEIDLTFGDDDDVPELVARHKFIAKNVNWQQLTTRTRKRLRNLAKKQLHSSVLGHMTADLLEERDPEGEVRGWLCSITELASLPRG